MSDKAAAPAVKRHGKRAASGEPTAMEWKFINAFEGNATAAAEAAGYKSPNVQSAQLMKKPHISKLCAEKMEKIRAANVKAAIRQSVSEQFDVMQRAIELARLEPSDTNGNIAGQVRACDLIARMEGRIIERNADVTEEEWKRISAGKSIAEKDYYAKHGKWPSRNEPGEGGGLSGDGTSGSRVN